MMNQVVPLVLESARAEEPEESCCHSMVAAQDERMSRSALWALQRACFIPLSLRRLPLRRFPLRIPRIRPRRLILRFRVVRPPFAKSEQLE